MFGARIYPLPGTPRGVSSASGSSCLHVVGKGQDGNLDQSATLKSGVFSAPGNKKGSAGSVKEDQRHLAERPAGTRATTKEARGPEASAEHSERKRAARGDQSRAAKGAATAPLKSMIPWVPKAPRVRRYLVS